MSHEPTQVTVFSFQTLEGGVETMRKAPFKATREHIRTIFGARVLEGSAERVPASALNAEGCYRRIATGWGEL